MGTLAMKCENSLKNTCGDGFIIHYQYLDICSGKASDCL